MAAATSNMNDTLELLETLSLGKKTVKNYLEIKSSSGGFVGAPKFHDYSLIGKFEISGDQKYSGGNEKPEIPKLISASRRQALRGTALGAGYNQAIGLIDYNAYHELKQDFFMKWLLETNYFKKVQDKTFKRPDFICFGGRITDPMLTPLKTRFGEWDIYGVRFMDTIFLWDEKTAADRHRTKESFYGIAFEALMTGINPATEVINEFEKTFVSQEAKFGTHQLLLVSEVDAQSDDGKWVEIKVYKACSPKGLQAKFLGYWAQSVVAGQEKILVGRRDDDGRLQETNVYTLDQMVTKAACTSMHINRCYDFQSRLHDWIKDNFVENNPKLVKKFHWGGYPSPNITCSVVPESELPVAGMFPQWFIDGCKNK